MLLWKREKKKERERKQKSDAFLFRWWGWWGWKNDWAPNLPQWASYTGHYPNRHHRHHTSPAMPKICKWGGSLITITIISLRLTLFSRQTRNIFPFVKTGKLEWHWFLVNFSISGLLRWWEERAILSLSFAAIFPRFWNSEILLSPKSDVIFFFSLFGTDLFLSTQTSPLPAFEMNNLPLSSSSGGWKRAKGVGGSFFFLFSLGLYFSKLD